MKISDLSAATDVPVATLKYYLREGLLPPGEPLTRTSADYGDAHVERVRLIRALTSVGGLSLATTARVLEVIEEPSTDRVDVMGAAQRALLGEDFVVVPEGDGVVGDGSDEGGFPPSRCGTSSTAPPRRCPLASVSMRLASARTGGVDR